MVSAITPGPSAIGPNTSAQNAVATEPGARDKSGLAAPTAPAPADTLVAQPAHWRAARESVRLALADLDLTLAAGREAATIIGRIGEAARGQDDQAVRALLGSLDALVQGAVANGAAALSGAAVRAQTDPDAAPFEVAGFDLRLKDDGAGAQLSRATSAADAEQAAAAAAAAQETLARLEAALQRLSAAAARLQAHDGFLAALETSVSGAVKSDIDAEAARLLALNVRQGLSESDAAIANVHPDSVLALFRS
jgi:hypothetical protein